MMKNILKSLNLKYFTPARQVSNVAKTAAKKKEMRFTGIPNKNNIDESDIVKNTKNNRKRPKSRNLWRISCG